MERAGRDHHQSTAVAGAVGAEHEHPLAGRIAGGHQSATVAQRDFARDQWPIGAKQYFRSGAFYYLPAFGMSRIGAEKGVCALWGVNTFSFSPEGPGFFSFMAGIIEEN